MSITVVSGLGFYIPKTTIFMEHLHEFILNHRNTINTLDECDGVMEIIDEMEHCPIDRVIDELETLYIECDDEVGINGIIALVMSAETGIDFSYAKDEQGDDEYILSVNKQPFRCTENEKTLTEEQFNNIVTKYMNELGISGIIEHITLIYNSPVANLDKADLLNHLYNKHKGAITNGNRGYH